MQILIWGTAMLKTVVATAIIAKEVDEAGGRQTGGRGNYRESGG